MRNYYLKRWELLLLLAIGIIVGIALSSCSSVKKAEKILNDHQTDAAQYCATKFPPRDSIVVRDSLSTDTLYVDNTEWWKLDTLLVVQKGDSVKIPCPPVTIITKRVSHDSLIFRENTAKVTFLEANLRARDKTIEVYRDKLQITEDERDKYRERSRKYFWWLIVIISGVLGWGFRKQIGGLLKIA